MDPVLLNPLIALVAGVLILLMPRILNYVVAIYLIAIGIIGLAQHLQKSCRSNNRLKMRRAP